VTESSCFGLFDRVSGGRFECVHVPVHITVSR
jgi:hypothetical protein